MKYLSFLLIPILAACGPGKNPDLCQVSNPNSNVTVHSYGDSITAGAGASVFCAGYQADFTNDLGANGDDEGISGSTLNAEMPRILSLQAAPQDIITLLPGFNDVTQFGSDQMHLESFRENLITSLNYLSTQGKMVLVGTTLYASVGMQATQVPLHTNQNVDLYVAVIKDVVTTMISQGKTTLHLVDTNSVYTPDTMTDNNIHPDDHGHAVLANLFLESYEGAL